MDQRQSLIVADRSLEMAIARWLVEKKNKSKSDHTRRAYEQTLRSFRSELWSHGLDLDSESAVVRIAVEAWAQRRDIRVSRKGKVIAAKSIELKGASYNHRLACVSSFYTFATRKGLGNITTNPITGMERASTKDSEHAKVLDADTLKTRLGEIDRTTKAGQRDYALLSIAAATGRRAMELTGLRCGNVEIDARDKVTLHFTRTKGGGNISDTLSLKTSQALLRYMATALGEGFRDLDAEQPLWMSLSHNNKEGGAITTQAIADICEKRLGVSTVHTLRHSFAKAMDDLGAPLTTIQRRLGHSNVAITARYLHSLPNPINPYSDQLEDALGIE